MNSPCLSVCFYLKFKYSQITRLHIAWNKNAQFQPSFSSTYMFMKTDKSEIYDFSLPFYLHLFFAPSIKPYVKYGKNTFSSHYGVKYKEQDSISESSILGGFIDSSSKFLQKTILSLIWIIFLTLQITWKIVHFILMFFCKINSTKQMQLKQEVQTVSVSEPSHAYLKVGGKKASFNIKITSTATKKSFFKAFRPGIWTIKAAQIWCSTLILLPLLKEKHSLSWKMHRILQRFG